MKASTALQAAINGKHIYEVTDVPFKVISEWQRTPGWDLLRRMTGLRFDVGELYVCEAEIVSGGSGCLIMTLALPIIPDRGQTAEEYFFDKEKVKGLRILKHRYDVSRMWIRTMNKKKTIYGDEMAQDINEL